MSEEISPGGSRMIQHDQPAEHGAGFECVDEKTLEKIEAHIETHLGPTETVWHEIVSEIVHIDIHIVPPSPGRDYYTLVTSGMSALPMSAPKEFSAYRFGELYLNLPKTWKMGEEALKDEANYWPIRWLKQLARFPHEYATWLFFGHTIPNGDPAEPIADTKFIGMLLGTSIGEFVEFETLELSKKKTIYFLNVLPLFQKEMNLKLAKGAEHVEEMLYKKGLAGPIDPKRKPVTKKWGIF